MPVAKLKLVAWKPRNEFLKMLKKRHFSYIPEGIAGEGMHPGGWKFIQRFNFLSTTTYQNLGPFQDMPTQMLRHDVGVVSSELG